MQALYSQLHCIHILNVVYRIHWVNYMPCIIGWKHTVPWYNIISYMFSTCLRNGMFPLHWRHNEHDGVSNHQPHDCLLNRLSRRRSKKTSKLRVTGLCAGNSPGPVNSPHKGPVTRKMFPFDDFTMSHSNGHRPWTCYIMFAFYVFVTRSIWFYWSRKTRSIPLLSMPWLLVSPRQYPSWHLRCMISTSLFLTQCWQSTGN